MKKKILFIALASMLGACTKDLTSLNVDPKNPLNAPSYSLFTQGERLLTNTVTTPSVNSNVFRLIEEQWSEVQYVDESNYDFNTRSIPDNLWRALYLNGIQNLERSKKLIPTDVVGADKQKNEIAIADIMQVYAFYYLVTTFGNIPYTDATDIDKPFPKFDDAATVYADLFKRLDADIAALNPSAESFGAADVIYGGDVASWKKFANTFKLKMALTIADVDNTKAKSAAEAAVAGGVFTTNADNAAFKYLSGPPNTNPVWVNLVQSQRFDFVAGEYIIDVLQPQGFPADPRLPYYFDKNKAGTGVYAGNAPGNVVSYPDYSLPAGPLLTPGSVGKLTNPDFPGILLDYSETEFLLAEAAQRGYNVGGTTEDHYNKGVTASILYWAGETAEAQAAATSYLKQSNVAFATAPGGTPLKRIAGQKYIALYNRGWDAWIDTRKFDYPVLQAPADAVSEFPVRLTYPVNEQNVNQKNYTEAATAIGGDVVTTKLWFDKN